MVTIDSKWTPNKPLEALNVYGTSSLEHPAVQMVSMERGKYYMGERVPGWRGLPLGVQLAQAVSMERGRYCMGERAPGQRFSTSDPRWDGFWEARMGSCE